MIKYKYIFWVWLLSGIAVQAQCVLFAGISNDITFQSGAAGEQQMLRAVLGSRFDLTTGELCDPELTFVNKPDWVSIELYAGSSYTIVYKVTALSANLGSARKEEVTVTSNGSVRTFTIEQPIDVDSKFIAEDSNHISSKTYNINGKVISQSRTYFDELGKGIQSQSWDAKTKKVWATQTVYDVQGRPALSTSAAPVGSSFKYKNDFIRDASGNIFNEGDLGTITSDPSPVSNTVNTLGNYYSATTANETYRDVTDRPYARTFYDELNPGKTLKTVGGNKVDTTGDGKLDSYPQGFSYTMPAAHELFYAFGKEAFFDIINSENYYAYTIQKTVTIDAHGQENVAFTTPEGVLIASARSGEGPKKLVNSLVGDQKFVDIHLPKGCESSMNYFGGAENYQVFDLKTGLEVADKDNLTAGVYRIESLSNEYTNSISYIFDNGTLGMQGSTTQGVSYYTNYYDFSLNYYDDAGNLKSSLPPVGFNNETYADYNLTGTVSHINESMKSHYVHNSIGQLLYTSSPDQGEAWFKYRTDGQIRFSQNSKQKENKEFSYTNYDTKARPVESGIYKESSTYTFVNSDVDKALDESNRSEQQFTRYDIADNEGLKAAFGTDARAINYSDQNFVEGVVAKSYTQNPTTSTTWYSYDIYGRVTWIVQVIDGFLGAKIIDYEYDDITGAVTKIYYQKGSPEEEFVHRYTYDPDDYSLIRVETATNDAGPYTIHADYSYYETGGVKRLELAEGLQGIDYVYNLNGSLKAINHPSLEATKDPGGDADDVFGMHIDYYKGDYNRSGVHISPSDLGTDQYNGNIKAVRWNNKAVADDTTNEKSYAYQYNRNNWLTAAEFNQGESIKIQALVIKENISILDDVTASEEILLNEGVTILGTANLINLSIGDEELEAGTDDYKVSGITYDANGNIQSLKRNQGSANGSNQMDDLTYHYSESHPNQLGYLEDKVTGVTDADDIKSQDLDNYKYNSIGQLIENTAEQLTYEYNAAGLVTLVKKEGTPAVSFIYNDRGQRIKKGTYHLTGGYLKFYEFYVRDLSGKLMATYKYGKLGEHPVYGTSRLGMYNRIYDITTYELTDHLGNVRATVANDEEIKGGTDYYPFGMPMPDRNTNSLYRYAYQGQEKDLETGKEAFELRLWYSRIGRWLTTDPAGQYASPYLGMGNNPVNMIDPDGAEAEYSGRQEEMLVTASADGSWTSSFWSAFSWVSYNIAEPINDMFNPIAWIANGTSGLINGTDVNGRPMSQSDIIYEFTKLGTAGIGSKLQAGKSSVVSTASNGGAKSSTTTAYALGETGERAVGIPGSKVRIPSLTGTASYRVPDALSNFSLSEVKNVANQSLTRQLIDFHIFSQATGRIFFLHTRPNTTLSKPLQNMINQGQIIHITVPKL